MSSYNLTHLKELESEAIFILREVAAQFEKPVMLFSGGKDSIIMFHLARKAFHPAKIPFPLMHVDTGHNFPETLEFRDRLMKDTGETLIVKYVQDSIDRGTAVEETGPNPSRNGLQTVTLLEGLEEGINKGDGIDSYKRYIYVHGTSEEGKIGSPASHGCIRMKNKDVIDLFNEVAIGTFVLIL